MKMPWLILAATLLVGISPMAMADEVGKEWLSSAPTFCRSNAYGDLTTKQRSMCDEAAFRYLSKNWKTITASNGQEYEIALDTIVRPLPDNEDAGATLRAAEVVVYVAEGETFNPSNVFHFYFDCQGRFQTFSSFWTEPAYAPRLSVAAQISSIACTHSILGTKKEDESPTPSYDPIPAAWSIPMNQPGWLSVGAEYCTQFGGCQTVGEGSNGLPPIPLKGGGTAPPSVGCRENPDYPACVGARVPVTLLARSPVGSVIVRMNGRNYAIGGLKWAQERPDGTAIGGPIMVQNPDGEILPLHYALRGMTQKAHLEALQQHDQQRNAQLAGILRIKHEPCDQMTDVTEKNKGLFVISCVVAGRPVQYTEAVTGW
jgi:hypothetical protein